MKRTYQIVILTLISSLVLFTSNHITAHLLGQRNFPIYVTCLLLLLSAIFIRDKNFEIRNVHFSIKLLQAIAYGYIASFLSTEFAEVWTTSYLSENERAFHKFGMDFFIVKIGFPFFLGGWINALITGAGLLILYRLSKRKLDQQKQLL